MLAPTDLAATVALAALAAAAALAGWLGARRRPSRQAALESLVRGLAERVRALEARLDAAPAPTRARGPEGPPPRADRPEPPRPPGPTLIAVPDLAAPPADHSEAAAELARRFGPVWDLADAGTPAEAIARASGHPIGQVELILGLRRRLARPHAGPEADP
jgi:hypothetical protein